MLNLYLITFCDIREVGLVLQKQLYFVLYHVMQIFEDGYEEKVLEQLGIQDTSFLYTFGANTNKASRVYKTDFLTRLFSCGNEKELTADERAKDILRKHISIPWP